MGEYLGTSEVAWAWAWAWCGMGMFVGALAFFLRLLGSTPPGAFRPCLGPATCHLPAPTGRPACPYRRAYSLRYSTTATSRRYSGPAPRIQPTSLFHQYGVMTTGLPDCHCLPAWASSATRTDPLLSFVRISTHSQSGGQRAPSHHVPLRPLQATHRLPQLLITTPVSTESLQPSRVIFCASQKCRRHPNGDSDSI